MLTLALAQDAASCPARPRRSCSWLLLMRWMTGRCLKGRQRRTRQRQALGAPTSRQRLKSRWLVSPISI
jgi:hypothetical protein